jgi:hypothetical protein
MGIVAVQIIHIPTKKEIRKEARERRWKTLCEKLRWAIQKVPILKLLLRIKVTVHRIPKKWDQKRRGWATGWKFGMFIIYKLEVMREYPAIGYSVKTWYALEIKKVIQR